MKKNIGTFEGTGEEIEFVKKFNSGKIDKTNFDFKSEDLKIFAIHVIHFKESKILNKKIRPKSDAFLASGYVPLELLKSKNNYLNEDDFDKLNLNFLPNTGISIKLPESTFTFNKISPDTFDIIFKNLYLGAGASIYCKNSHEFYKNESILDGWKVDKSSFLDYFNKIFNSNYNLDNLDFLNQIKKYSNKEIKRIICQNESISNIIFKGYEHFEDPFYAEWIFLNGKIQKNKLPEFIISTGSGRSKGDFTIVIKPK